MQNKPDITTINSAFSDKNLSKYKLYDSVIRKEIYKLRAELAKDAFGLRDWLDASECGGIKAAPKFVSMESKDCDEFSLIKLNYKYDSLCGYMDSPYHTGYDPKDVYSDVYKVSNTNDSKNPGFKVECIAGHESSGSIGAVDVFHAMVHEISQDGTHFNEFRKFEYDDGKVAELYSKYSDEFNNVFTVSRVLNNVRKFFAKNPEVEVVDHGYDHAVRVYNKALKIIEMETENESLRSNSFSKNINQLVVSCAAILHDVDDHKFFDTSNYGNARRIMFESGVDEKTIEKVVDCIDQIGFSKNRYNKPTCLEAGVVRDADRLDSMGAFGIMRTLIYGGATGRPVEESIKHCSEKILHLHKHMCTDGGRRLAYDIASHAESFIINLGKEYALSDNISSYGNVATQVADNLVTRYEIKKSEINEDQDDNMPHRRKDDDRDYVVVDSGDFSSDRIYPDLNPEFFE